MPTYAYRCKECGHEFEIRQRFSDDPLRDCPVCEESALRKVVNSVGIVFKGSGFYVTDNRGGKSASSNGSGSGKKSESDDSSADSKSTSSSDSKSESKSSDGGGKKSDGGQRSNGSPACLPRFFTECP